MGEREELLDVLDDAGEPTGQKSRAQIHRDHDRHGLVFVWSAWESEGRQYLLLQRRGSAGDPFLGRADALAGGHIGAGETSTSAARRELIEEVGLQAGPDDLIHLGSGLKLRPIGNCRRVVQHHLLYRGAVDMEKLSFSPEVDGFFLVALQDFIGLLSGRRTRIAASIRTREGTALGELRADAVIDYPDAILDTFHQSMASLSEWLATGVANPRHFE